MAVFTVSRQVAPVFGDGSCQPAQSQDGISLNDRTVSEKQKCPSASLFHTLCRDTLNMKTFRPMVDKHVRVSDGYLPILTRLLRKGWIRQPMQDQHFRISWYLHVHLIHRGPFSYQSTWSCVTYLDICTLKYTLSAITAPIGRAQRYCGIPSCPKYTQVTSDGYLIKGAEHVHLRETWRVLDRLRTSYSSLLGQCSDVFD